MLKQYFDKGQTLPFEKFCQKSEGSKNPLLNIFKGQRKFSEIYLTISKFCLTLFVRNLKRGS